MIKFIPKSLFYIFLLIVTHMAAQHNSWQQRADYEMELDVDVNTFRFSGTQKLTYTNNSPDTLGRVFYHMYFNAFQPGSEMDIRLQNIEDPDSRMLADGQSRIANLKPEEIGYLKATSL